MARLTNKIRKEILGNWTEKKWQKRFDSAINFVAKEAAKQISCVFDELEVSDDVRKQLIEKRIVSTNNTMYCYEWGIREFSFVGSIEPFSNGVNVPSYHTRYNSSRNTFNATDKMMKRLNDIKKEFINQRDDIEAILNSVTTDNKLFELLPEIKKYYPKPEVKPSTQLIAVDQISQVKGLL